MNLLHFAVRAAAGQVTARAVSIAVPFVIIHLHAPDVLTDLYFFMASIALFFHATVANAITDATVPLEHRGANVRSERFWALVSAVVGCSVLLTVFVLLPASFPYPLTMATGIALTAGCGLFSGYLAGILHAHHNYLATGLTWSYRLLPLTLYWMFSPQPTWLSWLALGLGMVDAFRAYTLYQLTRPYQSGPPPKPVSWRVQLAGYYWPAVMSAALPGLNPIIDRTIAALDGPGGISMIEAGDRLYGIIGGLATVGVMNVALTHLSRSHANGTLAREWSRVAQLTLGWSLLWLAVGWIAGHLVFESEQWQLLRMDSETLMVTSDIYYYYTAGLPAFIVGIVYVRRLFATGQTSLLVPIAITSVIANAIVSFGLYKLIGLAGIALATTMVYSATALALIFLTRGNAASAS